LNSQNLGFAHANNQVAAIAKGEIFVFLNNDTVVTKGWLNGLVTYLGDQSIGMVGPVTNFSGNESMIPVQYNTLDDMDLFAKSYVSKHFGRFFEIKMLPFHCVALRKSVWEEIGPLDESFKIGMFEDDDYAMRVKINEYKLICAEDIFIHHWGKKSFEKLSSEKYQEIFEKNRRIFEEKWGTEWEPHQYR